MTTPLGKLSAVCEFKELKGCKFRAKMLFVLLRQLLLFSDPYVFPAHMFTVVSPFSEAGFLQSPIFMHSLPQFGAGEKYNYEESSAIQK